MKKIEFGFNKDDKLNAQWSGIEFYNGEYLDKISYEGMDFLITRIVDSIRGLNGNIDVREIAQDYYSDGGYVTYANLKKNAFCQKLEEYLNRIKVKEKIAEGKLPIDILRSDGFPVHMSYLQDVFSKSETVSSLVTSIKPEVFNNLKESKRYCVGKSMYDMTQEIMKLRMEIDELKNNNREESVDRHF